MKKYLNKSVAVMLFSTLLLGGCVEKEEVDEPKKEGLAVNEWIASTMRENYLWDDEIPASTKLNYAAEPQDFFTSLLSRKDGKTRNGSHHYYSYIEKNKDYSPTRGSIDRNNTYGMEFVVYTIQGENNQPLGYYWARILYVLPNSPAASAGLQRGDWLVGFDGNNDNMTRERYPELLKGRGLNLTAASDPRNSETYQQIGVSASRAVEDNPIFAHWVKVLEGRKIGYLLYNHFSTGPGDHTDRTYDRQLDKLFADFAQQGVTEFVLDLRYNGGGYLLSANVLAGLLVPERSSSEVFSISTDNKGRQSRRMFDSENPSAHLNLQRLYVLTSSSTASASEAVINGLSPFLDVYLIGEKTEGKNVGSINFAKDEYEWALQPIMLRLTSSDVNYDYSSGLPVDLQCNEFDSKQNTGDQFLPLGDEAEFMLSKALGMITGRSRGVASNIEHLDTRSVQPINGKVIYNSLDKYQTNGVLVVPN